MRDDHRLADQTLVQLVIFTKNRQAPLLEPAAKHTVEHGGIDNAAFDRLSLHCLIAKHLHLNLIALLIQSQMLQP